MLRRFFSSPRAVARGQPGWRAYAVGDVHGRLDLLDALLRDIVADHQSRAPARGLVVLVGDLIDRGPDSAGVIDRLRRFDEAGLKVVGIAGNHEEVLLTILSGDPEPIEGWLRFGGTETLRSYGADPEAIAALPPETAQRRITELIPTEHRFFLEELGDSLRFGDYLFVHAGIRPGVPLDQQSLRDLRWIREPFLSDTRDHGVIVVHGHTIRDQVEEVGSRIGIDTGAYASGRLTALAIEGDQRWQLSALEQPLVGEKSLV